MGFLSNLFGGNDHQLAETKYADRESATDRAARKRRQSHHAKGIRQAATAGERWEQQDRRRYR